MAERPDWNSASVWNGYVERLWKRSSVAGSMVGAGVGVGGVSVVSRRVLLNGSARGLRVEGLGLGFVVEASMERFHVVAGLSQEVCALDFVEEGFCDFTPLPNCVIYCRDGKAVPRKRGCQDFGYLHLACEAQDCEVKWALDRK
jgi:hypothetical protein